MEGKRLFRELGLGTLLSYGRRGVRLELEPLNVLIGPNASGKSNLIQAISLLAAAPRNILAPFREGGTVEDWIWKGPLPGSPAAGIGVELELLESLGVRLSYNFSFMADGFRLHIIRESLSLSPGGSSGWVMVREHDRFKLPARPDETLSLFDLEGLAKDGEAIDSQESVFSRVRDLVNHRELTCVGDQLGKISLFRGWPFGRDNPLRKPQAVNLPDDFLLEDGSNLGLILNDLQNRRSTKRLILEKLRLLYPGIEDVTTKVQGGTIQIFFHEEGLDNPIPAARLSDGTLHYLCLLTVLLHPDPPPLICIEEPELGLHPDVIRTIAELLIDASKRTQLIVTTHSDALVSAFSETPEAVVVCERNDQGTQLRRLEPEKLKEWLEHYTLGDLWAKGEIGGNRW